MTYIRDPRDPNIWESDGEYNGKFKALDGTLHNNAQDALDHDRTAGEKTKRSPAPNDGEMGLAFNPEKVGGAGPEGNSRA